MTPTTSSPTITPLRIAIDGNEANVSNRVGSNVYAFQLLVSLEKITALDPSVRVTVLLTAPPVADLPPARASWQYRVIKPARLSTQIGLPLHLFLHHHDYDVFFTPGHYAPRLCSVPYVSSVMDLAFLHFPEQFKKTDAIQLTNWTKYSVKNASRVIAISQATKQDVMEQYGKKSEQVVVAYPALESQYRPTLLTRARSVLRKFHITQPYFVYVGTLQPRKNIIRMVEGFEKFCRLVDQRQVRSASRHQPKARRQLKYQLVLAGKVGWLADDILNRIQASPVVDQICLTGYVTDVEKQVLYEQAVGSVLLGLYEGFGIPPLESLQTGTIPMVANTTSLPEVVGKAGVVVDPYQVDEIAQGFTRLATMTPKDKAMFQKAARQQLKKFNWDDSARIVLATLREVGA